MDNVTIGIVAAVGILLFWQLLKLGKLILIVLLLGGLAFYYFQTQH